MTQVAAPTELKAYRHPVVRRHRGVIAALIAVIAVTALTLPVAVGVWYGEEAYVSIALSFPGAGTTVVAAVVQTLAVASAWILLGCLVSMLFLLATPGRDRAVIAREPELRWAQAASGTWMVASGALVVIEAADKNGQPLTSIVRPGTLAYLIDASDFPKAWGISAVLAAIAFLILLLGDRWTSLLVPLWCALIGTLAPVVVGHILVGHGHDFGSDAGALQTVAMGVMCGTLWAMSGRVATGRLLRIATLRRLAGMLGALWLVSALADAVLIPFKLTGPAEGNPTWLLLTLRAAVLALLGLVLLAGWIRRRRLRDASLRILLGAGSALAGLLLGLTLALDRVPPPQYFAPSTIMSIFFGFDLTAEPTLATLATTWRPNILLVSVGIVAVGVYLLAVNRLRRRGDHWPVGRTVAWVAGWLTVAVATSSGLGVYSGSDFAIHMIVHMALNMLAPVLLVMAGVVTLLLRATAPHRPDEPAGPHEWLTALLNWSVLRVLYSPIIIFVLYVGSYYALYLTGLFETIIRFHWAHQAMNIHFLIVGYLFYSLIIGIDRPPRPLPPVGKLAFVLAAMPFHAFFGVILMMASTPIAENFYLTLKAQWQPDLMLSQYVGGGVAWAGSEVPLVIVIVALGIQWARQDQREATRKDRHLDSELDDEFNDYNRMLDRLTQRDQTTGPRERTPS
ncbi:MULTISPECIES: cytochrome c oxidase assembly protein [unclassified Microbacterium]|uniref:cytochrome c oxidase assembly protein n=1 Tax=unclassified Microbacterium TaxID=2609290 RepID=UPI00386FA280